MFVAVVVQEGVVQTQELVLYEYVAPEERRNDTERRVDNGWQRFSKVVVGDVELLSHVVLVMRRDTSSRSPSNMPQESHNTYICQVCHLLLRLRKGRIFLWRPAGFLGQLLYLVLRLFIVKSLVLPLLDRLADGKNAVSRIRGRLDDPRVDLGDLLHHVVLQLGIRLLELEGPVELQLGGIGEVLAVAVG